MGPGTLPASWNQFKLQELDLGYNQLRGTLPASWGVDGSWPGVTDLDLSNNQLTGT